MEKTRNSKRSFSIKPLDAFIICAIFLVIVAVIGQDVAVYFINQRNSSSSLRINFVARSVEKEEASVLAQAQSNSLKGLDVRKGLRSLGNLEGEFLTTEIFVEGVESSHLCDLSGTMIGKGRTENGTVSLYGYGEIKEGDVLSVYVNGTLIRLELTAISADNSDNEG